MSYQSLERQRACQREWSARRRREQGVPERVFCHRARRPMVTPAAQARWECVRLLQVGPKMKAKQKVTCVTPTANTALDAFYARGGVITTIRPGVSSLPMPTPPVVAVPPVTKPKPPRPPRPPRPRGRPRKTPLTDADIRRREQASRSAMAYTRKLAVEKEHRAAVKQERLKQQWAQTFGTIIVPDSELVGRDFPVRVHK